VRATHLFFWFYFKIQFMAIANSVTLVIL
jgi:hypothetical protein